MSNRRAPIGSAQVHHRFFVVTSGVLLAITLVGFSPSFFLKVFFEDPGMIVRVAELLRSNGGGGGLKAPPLPLHVVAHGIFTVGPPGRVRLRECPLRYHDRTRQYGCRAVLGGRVDDLTEDSTGRARGLLTPPYSVTCIVG